MHQVHSEDEPRCLEALMDLEQGQAAHAKRLGEPREPTTAEEVAILCGLSTADAEQALQSLADMGLVVYGSMSNRKGRRLSGWFVDNGERARDYVAWARETFKERQARREALADLLARPSTRERLSLLAEA